MNKKENTSSSFTNIGLSSLMVVFLVLCLTTFALLTLSTAKSDYSLSEKMADHRTDYYSTCSQAEKILDKIDKELEENRDELLSKESFLMNDIIVIVEDDILSYDVPLDNGQYLTVRIRATDPSATDTFYEILSWQVQE